MGVRVIGMALDSEGVDPVGWENLLCGWDETARRRTSKDAVHRPARVRFAFHLSSGEEHLGLINENILDHFHSESLGHLERTPFSMCDCVDGALDTVSASRMSVNAEIRIQLYHLVVEEERIGRKINEIRPRIMYRA
jgi:hypothetical protein